MCWYYIFAFYVFSRCGNISISQGYSACVIFCTLLMFVYVCVLLSCSHTVQLSVWGRLLSLLFPPPLPAFLPFYPLPPKQITQTQKLPCEAEINAAIIYKQSQQIHKGEPLMGRRRSSSSGGDCRACCCHTCFLLSFFKLGLALFQRTMEQQQCTLCLYLSLWLRQSSIVESFLCGRKSDIFSSAS